MPESQNLITSGDVVISAEWSEHKQHWIVRRNGEKWLYCHNHCGHKADWFVCDSLYRKICEIPATTRDEALQALFDALINGSLDHTLAAHYGHIRDKAALLNRLMKMQKQKPRSPKGRGLMLC
jgi:hypothetical protein